jgi:hypothetical protein
VGHIGWIRQKISWQNKKTIILNIRPERIPVFAKSEAEKGKTRTIQKPPQTLAFITVHSHRE